MILVAVEYLPVFSFVALIVGEGHRIKRCLQLSALQKADERRHRSIALLHSCHSGKRVANDAFLLGRDLNALLAQIVTEPIKRPLPFILIIDA